LFELHSHHWKVHLRSEEICIRKFCQKTKRLHELTSSKRSSGGAGVVDGAGDGAVDAAADGAGDEDDDGEGNGTGDGAGSLFASELDFFPRLDVLKSHDQRKFIIISKNVLLSFSRNFKI
jgi:hypothetical protein